ncbi:retrovirus-related pol polyprotein from transposon TNT 1-94 [Tanacetum coccineum]
MKKFIGTVRFGNDHFGAIMGYGDYVIGDSVISVGLNKTAQFVRTDNGTEFINKNLTDYYESVGITHEKTVLRTPQQNGIVERRNRTLVEAARTMLIFSKAPLFLWAEAVATACYTQNHARMSPQFPPRSIPTILSVSISFDHDAPSAVHSPSSSTSSNHFGTSRVCN